METAPLTLAHTHARNAVLETRKSNPVAASEEHDLAAGEFSSVGGSSTDREALRTLQLLEGHHKKLAEILRFQHENPNAAAATAEATMGTMTSPAAGSPGLSHGQPQGGSKTAAWPSDVQQQQQQQQQQQYQQQPPRLPGSTRLPPSRETSSIATNLASARGIPSHPRRASPASPTLSSQHAGAKMSESPTRARTSESRLRGAQPQTAKDRSGRVSAPKQPWSPSNISPTEITSQQMVPSDATDSGRTRTGSITEEPFQRFYSTFGGLISKLSAPLAFAGLPLGTGTAAETPAQADPSRRKTSAETRLDRYHAVPDRPSASTESEVSRLFSKAALRAIRDNTGAGGAGGVGGSGNPAESFYVVPTTGGTVSYAGILNRTGKEGQRNSIDEGEDDFVDARETPSSPELRQSMIGGTNKAGRLSTSQSMSASANAGRGNDKATTGAKTKTLEELQIENQTLKQLSDTLSKRLHMWEVNAQSSSIALQQSLRAMHYQSPSQDQQQPTPSTGPAGSGSDSNVPPSMSITNHEQRIKELEELVRSGEKELSQVGRENEKLRSVLGRYRERWEKLKEGAKTRRAESQANSQQHQQQHPHQNQIQQPKDDERSPSLPPRGAGAAAAAASSDDPASASDQQSTNSKVQGDESTADNGSSPDQQAEDRKGGSKDKDVGLLLLS